MPRPEQAIVVFVASPSDLEPERAQLETVIRELNLSWSQSLGHRLELVRWETHGLPGVGEDPQAVLNRALPVNPDIFIGLMWSRYGTATGRAGSGTEEEFNRALDRHKQDPNSIRIMFYFKEAPLAPTDIDPDQLRRVALFRKSLSEEGVLYWKFNTLDDFVPMLRLHLSRQLQALAAPSTETKDVGLVKFSVEYDLFRLLEPQSYCGYEVLAVDKKRDFCFGFSSDHISLAKASIETHGWLITDYTHSGRTITFNMDELVELVRMTYHESDFTLLYHRKVDVSQSMSLTFGHGQTYCEVDYLFEQDSVMKGSGKSKLPDGEEQQNIFRIKRLLDEMYGLVESAVREWGSIT